MTKVRWVSEGSASEISPVRSAFRFSNQAASGLSKDVGHQLVFKAHDAIFQYQFFLFKSGDLKLVDQGLRCECPDGIVEIPMFNLQLFKLLQITVIVHVPY